MLSTLRHHNTENIQCFLIILDATQKMSTDFLAQALKRVLWVVLQAQILQLNLLSPTGCTRA